MKSGKVYILGNGPSLKKVNFSALGDEDIITMNSFHLGRKNNNLNIVAHCFGEPVSSPAWMFDDFKDSMIKNYAESYWVHYSSLSYAKKLKINTQIIVPGIGAGLWRSGKINLSSISLSYASTAQLAIQVAMYLGYDEIVLLGFDHDWLSNSDHLAHFYSDKKDHTDKLSEEPYLTVLNMVKRLWHLYISISNSSSKSGIKITNGTRNSNLDVFPFELKEELYLRDNVKKSVSD